MSGSWQMTSCLELGPAEVESGAEAPDQLTSRRPQRGVCPTRNQLIKLSGLSAGLVWSVKANGGQSTRSISILSMSNRTGQLMKARNPETLGPPTSQIIRHGSDPVTLNGLKPFTDFY